MAMNDTDYRCLATPSNTQEALWAALSLWSAVFAVSCGNPSNSDLDAITEAQKVLEAAIAELERTDDEVEMALPPAAGLLELLFDTAEGMSMEVPRTPEGGRFFVTVLGKIRAGDKGLAKRWTALLEQATWRAEHLNGRRR